MALMVPGSPWVNPGGMVQSETEVVMGKSWQNHGKIGKIAVNGSL